MGGKPVKTPREILLEQHGAAESKLDDVRRKALAAAAKLQTENSSSPLRHFLWSLRWHFAGMSAIWLVIALLNLDSGQGSRMVAAVPPAKIPPPEVILASLRENHRQLSQMIESQPIDAEQRKNFTPEPHSERRSDTLLA
jgi:hypothetical protein